jgi:predicted phosphoribosyltransferase
VLETPLTFRTLSAFYDNFRTVSDAEVRRLLAMNALQADRPTPSRE